MQKGFSQVTLSVWNGSAVDTAWFHDNRNASEFYIWTGAQLNGLAKLINSYETFAGKTVHVQNPDYPDEPVVIDLDNKRWKEIGTGYQGREFQGVFDGHNCVIKNIVTSPTDWKSYLGLFGSIVSTSAGPAGVRNVNATGRILSHWGTIGGIAGQVKGTASNRAFISNCTFNGEVTGSSTIGGIVGSLVAYSDISDCAVAGTVTGFESTVGGIVGSTAGNSAALNNISGCSNAAWVTSPEVTGGIAGTMSNTNVKYCHNGGNVYGNAVSTGGIAGSGNNKILYCINTGTVNMGGCITGTSSVGNISYCYYDNQRSSSTMTGIRTVTNDATHANGTTHSHLIAEADDIMPDGLGGTASEWTSHFSFKAGHYPIPKNLATKTAAIIASVPIYLPETPVAYYNEPANFTLVSGYSYSTDDPDHTIITIVGTDVTVGSTEGAVLITVTNTGAGLRDDEIWSKTFIIENPYTSTPELTIGNISELEAFRNAVNAGASGKYQGISAYNGFKGVIIKITGNIDMGSISSWSPIGTYENPFKGTLDGQCYLIKNLTVERTAHNSGLFGVLNSAKIQNIKLTGNVNSSTLYVGGFCGRTKGAVGDSTVFSNCHFYGTVSNKSYYIGGIIGYAGPYCVVENCSSGGNITTTSYNCGGIIGQSGGALRVENCINIAEVKGLTQVGGIIGYSDNNTTKIYNCLNAGNVYGTSENTGGIIAYTAASQIKYCINTGTVSAGGSIVGRRTGDAATLLSNNYYDSQRSRREGSNTGDLAGAAPKTTAELLALTSGTFSDKWNYVADCYPTPKNVGCDDPADAINNLVIVAAAPAIFNGDDDYTNLRNNATLGANVTWGSSEPDIISNTGVVSTSGNYGAAILTATKSGLEDITFRKRVLVSVAFSESPIPITNAADLAAFRDAVNAGLDGSYMGIMNLDGYCGKVFQLSGDISLTDPEWEPIGTTDNPFRGEFDGAGHKISDLNVSRTVSYSGLFGYVYSSCSGGIKNLVVEGTVSGTSYVGGICGSVVGLNTTTYCTIENCHFNGEVRAIGSYSGGIVGHMGNYTKTKYCTTTGNVFSTSSYVGGIVGRTAGYAESNINNFCTYKRDSVLNCINNAIVTGNSITGGICGQNVMSFVGYCLNAGEVKARSNAASFGGIVGTNDIARGQVSQCLNVYNFNGFEGNIIGIDNDTITTICPRTNADKNFYDSLHCAIGVKNESNGTGLRTSELVVSSNGTLPSGLSSYFTAGKWWLKAGYYPMPINATDASYAIALNPTLVAGTPATLAIGGAGTDVTDPDYVNTNQMTTRNFTVVTSDGQTLTPLDDGILEVSGSTVEVTNPNYRRTYLTVTIGNYSKVMYFANSLYVPPIAIRDITELRNLRDAVNRGSIGSFMACLYDEETGKPKKKMVNGVETGEYDIEEAFNVNGYKGVNFYLVNNDGASITLDLTNSNWSPIGTSTYIFKGSFHGKGSTIKTLRTNTSYAGLFGYIEGSVIENLNVQGYAYVNPTTGAISSDGAMVYGSSYIGGLVGFAKNAKIKNCHVSAIVNGTGAYVGGICGKSVGTKFENSDFSGKVITTGDYAGGICGYLTDTDSITYCTNAATVSGASYVGGIAGNIDNHSVIKFCNNGGNVSSTTEITGGICGNMENSSKIESCLSSGGVNIGGAILGTKDDASSISNCYYDTQRCDRVGGDGTTGKLTSEMLGTALRSILGTTHWTFTTSAPHLYPIPKNLDGKAGAILAAIPLTLDERGNATNHQTYREVSKNFDLVVPTGASWKTNCARNAETGRTYLVISNSNVPTVNELENDCANIFVKLNDNYHVKTFFIQNPTHEDPILIQSLAQFVKFRDAVNAGEIGSYKGVVNENGFTGKNFRLTTNINLADTTLTNVKDDFLPIGSLKYSFKGNFDGFNNTISNLQINGNGTNNNSPQQYRALFGYAIGSTIENLKVRCTDAGISGSSYVAGICSYIKGVDGDNYANIRNCSFIGKISTTSSYVGGICGYAYNYTNIDTCEVAGMINGGSSYTGGIVGYTGGSSDYRNYVRSCINVADVGGISLVGGISGNNATTDILFCENGGNINGAVYSTGGISGSNSGDILYCISTGNVSTGGAITGSGTNCHYNYYDRTRCSVNGIANDRNVSSDSEGAAMGLTPQQMTGTSPSGLTGTNWSNTYWDFVDGRFPTPKNHSSNITDVAAMPIFINDPEPAQVWNGTIVDFTLGSSENIWTSECDYDYVVINPANLPTATVDAGTNIPEGEIGTAIITATIGEAHKNYIVTSEMPPDSLSIKNYAELVAFRNAVNARGTGKYKGVLNSNGYVGITFYIINDIVVEDSEGPWVTIASEPSTFFGGNINGKDEDGVIHTVSNLNFNTADEENPSYYGGFIGRVYNGYIKNLIVRTGNSSYTNKTKPDGHFGGICAYISGQSATLLGEIENCKFYGPEDGTITTQRDNGTGGVCGYAAGWSKISKCNNYANIAGGSYTGGVVGYVNNTSGAYVNFTTCRNEGNITNRSGYTDRQYIGGVCGRYYSIGTMTNCENYGNVTEGIYVGGIAGGQGGTSTYNAIITNCINYGDISTTADKNYYGGITGYSTDFSTITYCANSGNITAKQHVGGISGLFSKAAAEKENIIKYCSNTGEINGTKYVGGICGRNAKTTISFCVNGGNVRGTTAELGGIIGENGTESATKNNLSTGCVERNTGIPNLGGSICGKNAGSLGDNKYDKQRSKRLGLGTSSADDATAMGYKTSELTGSSPSGMSGVWNSDNFSFAANMYPQPKGVSGNTPSILASTPIFITESPAVEIYDSVWNDFTLSTENSVAWSVVEDPANIAISGANATITRICDEDVPQTLLVTKDGVSKKVKVIIAKYESPELAEITATPEISSGVCLGQKIALETTSGYDSYEWAGANLLSDDTYNVEAQPTIRTTYTVTATNGHNCTSTVNITITPDNSPTPKTTSKDYVWTGAINDAWNTNNNWVLYNNSTHQYQIPAEAPNASTHNVFVEQYGTGCVTNWANASSDIALNNITLEANTEATATANMTISGNIANAGILNLIGDVTLNGTVQQTLSGSGTLTINNINVNNTHSDGVIAENTLDITGNVTVGNNSKLNVTGTAVFNGNATQTLSGTGSMAVSNVVFDNSNGFNATGLENNLAVNASATFTNGIYDGNMVFGKSANAIDASRISYVNGEVSKTGNGDSFIFPTGNDNVYGQIEAIVGDEDKATIRFHHKSGHGFSESEYPRWWNLADMDPGNNPQFDHVSNFEYWDVFASADLTDATLSIYAGDANDHFSTPTSFNIANIYGAMYKNGLWRNIGGGSGSVSPSGETIILENVTILGNSSRSLEFTKTSIGSKSQETILPIELLSFSAHCNGNTIDIDWSTASERNNDYFILEKSLDAINFNEIARIAGAGKSIEQIDYSYTDYDYYGGDVYYRLVQVDYDGTKTYSEIISAKCSNWETDPNISVFPNPFSSELTIVLENFRNEPATIEIFDVMGRTIKQMQVDSPHNEYETSFNLDNIPAGIYNVRVRTSSSTLNRQIVKE